ncbi:MAG: hypothetical protein K5633_03585 [Paludibacteraceae bacterium]|nr:hypothetical protein [Paludibacteraceae bacterium]
MDIASNQKLPTCVVVTFVWRELTHKEKVFLGNNMMKLQDFPFVVMHPKRFDVTHILSLRSEVTEIALDDRWFESVASYNEMMKSPWFYKLFGDYDFLLVCQIDAYILENQLSEWCLKGYDYVGAPWLANDNLYENTLGRLVRSAMKHLPMRESKIHSYHLYHEVGNGGLSLRRVNSMIDILERNQHLVECSKGKHSVQEDVFISFLIGKNDGLRIPDWREALYFSYEKAPAKALELTNGRMPFGFHDTNSKYWDSFWSLHVSLDNTYGL